VGGGAPVFAGDFGFGVVGVVSAPPPPRLHARRSVA